MVVALRAEQEMDRVVLFSSGYELWRTELSSTLGV